jgi:hypothetical protein
MRARQKLYMPHGCLYLNNDGSKWITNEMEFVLVLPDGTRKLRRADYYYSFGNFGGLSYRYKGQRFHALPKAHDGSETRDPSATGHNTLQHVFHKAD